MSHITRKSSLAGLIVSIGIAAACSADATTSTDGFARRGTWGSSQASLSVTDTSATIQILAGNCYGSYGDVAQPIPAGAFALNGTYTQLMGVYPGKVEYPAQFSGTVDSDRMMMTVTVPALQRTVGPFVLVHGVNSTWSRCLYP